MLRISVSCNILSINVNVSFCLCKFTAVLSMLNRSSLALNYKVPQYKIISNCHSNEYTLDNSHVIYCQLTLFCHQYFDFSSPIFKACLQDTAQAQHCFSKYAAHSLNIALVISSAKRAIYYYSTYSSPYFRLKKFAVIMLTYVLLVINSNRL